MSVVNDISDVPTLTRHRPSQMPRTTTIKLGSVVNTQRCPSSITVRSLSSLDTREILTYSASRKQPAAERVVVDHRRPGRYAALDEHRTNSYALPRRSTESSTSSHGASPVSERHDHFLSRQPQAP